MPRLFLVALGASALACLPGGPVAAQTTLTPISAIQGTGSSSPMVDQVVTVRGIVTAVFPQGQNNLDGFFVQDAIPDGDPATSEGLFVYRNAKAMNVAIRQTVDVVGKVTEFNGFTELQLATVTISDFVPTDIYPVPVVLPSGGERTARAYLESLEGMRVTLPDQVAVAGTNHFGESFTLPANGGSDHLDRGQSEAWLLGLTTPLGWLCLTQGDRVSAPSGVMAYTFGQFKVALSQDELAPIRSSGRQPSAAPQPSGPREVTIATYNVENFFDPVDDPDSQDEDSTPTAAMYPVTVARRARSIALGLGAPDVVALQEVEKLEVLRDLVARPELADAHYAPVLVEGADARGIDNALLYNQSKLRLLSADNRQACATLDPTEALKQACRLPNGGQGWMLFARPPLEVRLEHIATGQELVFLVNHFKSKSGGDAETRPYRVAQGEWVRELAERIHAEQPPAKLVVLGDLNDFEDSAMIRALTAGDSLVNLHRQPPPENDYTYVFNGVRQILDHILMPPGQAYSDFRNQHINADFCAAAPDDMSETAQRVSDHDPLFVRLPLDDVPQYHVYLPWAARPAVNPSTATPPAASATPRPEPPTPKAEPPTPATPPTFPPPVPTTTPSSSSPTRFPLTLLSVFADGDGRTEPDEYVEFRNVAGEEVDLTGWHLVSVQGDQVFSFPTGKRIAAGQTCRVYTNEDHVEHCGINWRSGQAIWANGGDKAELRNAAGMLVDHLCYGDRVGQCP